MLFDEEIVPQAPASEPHSTQEQSRLRVTQGLLLKPCRHINHGFPDANMGNWDLSLHPNTGIQRTIGEPVATTVSAGSVFSSGNQTVMGWSIGTRFHLFIP